MSKIAEKGATEAFLLAHVGHSSGECLIWPYGTNKSGYGLAVVNGVQRAASHWMCRLKHGPPQGDRNHAAHSCGNPICVNPQHLRWTTPAENQRDRISHGTSNHGERNGRTKLTAADVAYIRAAPPVLAPLMLKFGMSKHGISKIRSGKRWSEPQEPR